MTRPSAHANTQWYAETDPSASVTALTWSRPTESSERVSGTDVPLSGPAMAISRGAMEVLVDSIGETR